MNQNKSHLGDNNISRRKFLRGTLAFGIAGVLPSSFSLKAQEIVLESYENVENILSDSYINKSKNFVGVNEVQNFLDIFGVYSEEDFYDKVYSIQSEGGLIQDGILGQETLRYVYKYYYSNLDSFSLPVEIRNRYELQEVISNYKNKYGRRLFGLESPFDNDYFYGKGAGENIFGTYVNEKINNYFYDKGLTAGDPNYNGGNSIQVEKIDGGKYYIAMYVNGELMVLAHSSPGNPGKRTPQNRVDSISHTQKYKVSNSYPKGSGGAIMPFSFEMDASNGIYGHIGNVNGAGLSKGCVRIPGFYGVAIYNILEQYGKENFKVKVGNLY
ncbi:hypothetical protein DLH72_03755 [Candidatus Gracilibacteria bacterium]|nr:MAG: hypothetical protein DLH72_03755 [Candidatus Gracilibacteria bacterium]